MGIPIRVRGILQKWRLQYTVYQTQEKNKEEIIDVVKEANHESTVKQKRKTYHKTHTK